MKVWIHFPLFGSQSFKVRSSEHDPIKSSSAENLAQWTQLVCPENDDRNFRPCTCHSFTTLSFAPVTIYKKSILTHCKYKKTKYLLPVAVKRNRPYSCSMTSKLYAFSHHTRLPQSDRSI